MSESNRSWETVFFQVEDELILVPRDAFTESSEVFSGMFSLPPGGKEGLTRDSPIHLDGYLKDDFKALIRVLYTTTDDLIRGRINFTKEEFLRVLKLSTIWEMQKIRDFCIRELTALELTDVEKINYGRAHKVSTWFIEGLVGIVSDPTNTESERATELASSIGLETAYKLMVLKARLAASETPRAPPPGLIDGVLKCNVGALYCPRGSCAERFFDTFACYECGAQITTGHDSNVYFKEDVKICNYNWSAKDKLEIRGRLKDIRCVRCFKHAPSQINPPCPRCGVQAEEVRIDISRPAGEVEEVVKLEFLGELVEVYRPENGGL